MNNTRNNEHPNDVILAYLRSIEMKIEALEENNQEISKQVHTIQKTLLIGRVAVTVIGMVVAFAWWVLEHSTLLSEVYFKFIEGKNSYDHIRRSN